MASNGGDRRNYEDLADEGQNRDNVPSGVTTTRQTQENEVTSSPTNREGTEEPTLSYAQACKQNIAANSGRDPLTASTSSQYENQEGVKTDRQHSALQDHHTSDGQENEKKLDATRIPWNGYGQSEVKDTQVCQHTEQATGLNQVQNPAKSNTYNQSNNSTNFTTELYVVTAVNRKVGLLGIATFCSNKLLKCA